MESQNEGLYTSMFGALKHGVRRRILLQLSRGKMSFTELYETIGISSSHLNYHLIALDDLIMKRDAKYGLSKTGEKAVNMFSRYTSQKIEKPELSAFFKYLTVILFFMIVTLTTSLVHEYDVSTEIVKMGMVNAFILIVYTNWPVIIYAFMKVYYLAPLGENSVPFNEPLNADHII
jgi:DNA-binding transcriptional ArsR family regulator